MLSQAQLSAFYLFCAKPFLSNCDRFSGKNYLNEFFFFCARPSFFFASLECHYIVITLNFCLQHQSYFLYSSSPSAAFSNFHFPSFSSPTDSLSPGSFANSSLVSSSFFILSSNCCCFLSYNHLLLFFRCPFSPFSPPISSDLSVTFCSVFLISHHACGSSSPAFSSDFASPSLQPHVHHLPCSVTQTWFQCIFLHLYPHPPITLNLPLFFPYPSSSHWPSSIIIYSSVLSEFFWSVHLHLALHFPHFHICPSSCGVLTLFFHFHN